MTTPKLLLAILLVCTSMSCKKEDPRPVFRLEGLTMENYPKVDGSTSTQPLHFLVAAELLGGRYTWQQRFHLDGTWGISPNFDDIPMEFFFERIKTSQTHQSIINLIDQEADLIFSARKMSDDEKPRAKTAPQSRYYFVPASVVCLAWLYRGAQAVRTD